MKYRFLTTLLIALAFLSCNQRFESSESTDIIAVENGLLMAIQIRDKPLTKYNILERMAHYNVPGVSIGIVQDGKLKWAKGYGIANTRDLRKVDVNTLFQAGSISKPMAALAALKLVEEGVIDLDSDVNDYLKDWKVPQNKYTENQKVTLRRLLTHTAGMTVHGFPGYQQTDFFPSLLEVLNGEGNTPEITVDTIPGSIWRYSGGGYTVMQKIVEDMSGLPFEKYMQQQILEPLGMDNSTFEQPLLSAYRKNASAAYDYQGNMISGLWHNYPEKAVAGLWTTPADLSKYCIEIQEILSGKSSDILNRDTVLKMLTKDKNDWGLGPSLKWEGDSLIFQHGGKNAGFTNTMIAFAYRGNAAIIMTNADNGGKLIGETLRSISNYYHWGIADYRVVERKDLSSGQLNNLVGHYKYMEQVAGIGDYIVEISRDADQLIVIDANNGERDEVIPMEEAKFIDLEDGDEMTFQVEQDPIGFIWNNTYQFYKID